MVFRGAWCFVLLVFPLVSLIVDTQPSRIGNNDLVFLKQRLLMLGTNFCCSPTTVEAHGIILLPNVFYHSMQSHHWNAVSQLSKVIAANFRRTEVSHWHQHI
jgi:hypothetical protein